MKPHARKLFGALVVLLGLGLPPWSPWFPDASLDPSWTLFLSHALERGWRFGAEVVFPYGPLGALWTSAFHPATWWAAVLVRLGIAVAIAAGLAQLYSEAGRVERATLLAAVALEMGLAIYTTDLHLMLPALLAAVLSVQARPAPRLLLPLLVAAAVIVASMKFTLLVFAALALIAADACTALRWRRLPWLTAAYAAGFLGLWSGIGQRIGDLPAYLVRSGHMSSAYNEGMQVWGRPLDLWLIAGSMLAALTLAGLWRRSWRPGTPAALALTVLYAFTCFKAGTVRHDGHVLTALLATIYAGLLILRVASSAEEETQPRRLGRLALSATVLVAMTGCSVAYLPGQSAAGVAQAIGQTYADHARGLLRSLLFGERQAELTVAYEHALEGIRSQQPLPGVRGSLDIYPAAAGLPIAHGLDYRPRPVFQSYAANDRVLLELNADHLRGSGRPQTLLFDVAAIDARFPSQEEAPSYRVIDERFEFEGFEGRFLRLLARGTERPWEPVGETRGTVAFDEWLTLPESAPDEVLLLSLDVRPNLWGRLLQTVFKLPVANFEVEPAAGEPSAYRLVPAIARAGFIVTPLILDLPTAAAFFGGAPNVSASTARRVRVITEPLGRRVHAGAISWRVERYRRPLASKRFAAGFAALAKLADAQEGTPIAPAALGFHAEHTATPTLFAHAPASYLLQPPAGARTLLLGFGLRDVAWDTTSTDGACFSVAAVEGDREHPLFEQCLEARQTPGQRGLQHAAVDLSSVSTQELRLRVLPGPRNDDAGDWAYWAEVRFE